MTEQELCIEEAQVEDAAALAQLLSEVAGETDFLAQEEMRSDLTAESLAIYLDNHLQSFNQICLLAKLGPRVIGVLNVTADTYGKTDHIGDVFIAISQAYWGYGIGSLMFEALLDWAEHTPMIGRLELTVQARNERAIHLYRKFGFDIEGTKKRGAKTKNGEFLDVYLMAKLIN